MMNSLKTPVLFLVFNRIDTTKKVFREIQRTKPSQLFVASDGPRENRKGEREIVESVRKYILANVDWKCKVKTLFRKKNLGCKYAVSSAIDWFFKNVKQGIILEDDCLPSQSFFKFCQEMLTKYKDEKKVMMISGDNFIEKTTKKMKESYYFSRNAHIWGWATWKRAWSEYDVNIHEKLSKKDITTMSKSLFEYLLNRKRWTDLKLKRVDTWDYQWEFTMKKIGGLCVCPKLNLVENIGLLQKIFTNLKANESEKKYLSVFAKELAINPTENPKLEANEKLDFADNWLYLKKAFKNKIISILSL